MMDRVESISHMREKRSVRKRRSPRIAQRATNSALAESYSRVFRCLELRRRHYHPGTRPRAHSRRAADAATRHSYCAVPLVWAATYAERLRYTLNESKYRLPRSLTPTDSRPWRSWYRAASGLCVPLCRHRHFFEEAAACSKMPTLNSCDSVRKGLVAVK